MPTPATTSGGTARQTSKQGNNAGVLPAVPFIRASGEHREATGVDVSRTISTSAQDLGVFDIPAYGYVRSIVLLVTCTGGTGTAAVYTEDTVFAALRDIALTEPNGAIINQFTTGYELYLANKYGGYRAAFGADPKSSPVYSAPTSGNFSFLVRIPLELNSRDGLGSLPNQNSGATFKLRMTLNASTAVFGTPSTTLPTVRVRAYTEAWDQPEAATAGATNQVTPPAVNTTQFWSTQTYNVNSGFQTIRLNRVGNYVRNIVAVYRRGGTSRANGQSDWPDPLTVLLDTRPVDSIEANNFKQQMFERTGFSAALDAANGLDNGVRLFDFTHDFDGSLGRENRDLWLPTLTSTRFELQGTFANAGTLSVLTNDVALAGNVFL